MSVFCRKKAYPIHVHPCLQALFGPLKKRATRKNSVTHFFILEDKTSRHGRQKLAFFLRRTSAVQYLQSEAVRRYMKHNLVDMRSVCQVPGDFRRWLICWKLVDGINMKPRTMGSDQSQSSSLSSVSSSSSIFFFLFFFFFVIIIITITVSSCPPPPLPLRHHPHYPHRKIQNPYQLGVPLAQLYRCWISC